MMDHIDRALAAALPVLVKWRKKPRCPKCACKHTPNPHWFRGLVMVFSRRTYMDMHYCPGKMNPTIDVNVISSHGAQRHEVPLPCFGLESEHLHCQCNNCHYSFMMEVYRGKMEWS